MSFNTRVILILFVTIFILFGVWIFASMQITPSVATPTRTTSSSTDAGAGTPLFTSTSTNPAPAQTLLSGPDLPTVQANIVGTWQSSDDSNYKIKVSATGTWTDTYGERATNSVSQTGSYTLFTSANPDPTFTGTVTPGVVYIKLVEGKTTTFFGVVDADGSTLQLVYLDRGNTLSFVKVR